MQSSLTYAEAVELWLVVRRVPLSAASERAYRGEVGRLAAYAASVLKSLHAGELSENEWLEYLRSMKFDRSSILPRRSVTLSPSSLDQARRITASFLRWLHDQGVLSWTPDRVVARGTSRARSPIVLVPLANRPEAACEFRAALSGNLPASPSLKELRAHLVLNFAYWGGLTTSEIAQLKVSNLRVLPGQRGLDIRLESPQSPPAQPHHVAKLWRKYLAVRTEIAGHLNPERPAIVGLRTSEPLSSWAVWAIMKEWEESFGRRLTSSSLRRDYLDTRTGVARQELQRISDYTRCTYVDYRSSKALGAPS